MDVLVQSVRLSWTNASRGGPGAARRAAVPDLFTPPDQPWPLLHQVVLDEADGFRPQETWSAGLPEDGSLTLTEDRDRLLVLPQVLRYGLPPRRRRPPGVRLDPGQWLRWRLNYRFHSPGGWSYRLDTLNLAYRHGDGPAFQDPPAHDVDERAGLQGFLR